MKVAYLVNQYPHVSHTFIRREIAAHEAAGLPIRRYSVRSAPSELVDPNDLAEKEKTTSILRVGGLNLAWAALCKAIGKPLAFFQALRATWRLGSQANRRLRHFAYLVEACWLARDAAAAEVTHIHAHFGTNSATVALLCRLLGGPTYSFTVHGPEEFDHPVELSLPEKIQHANFVVGVSEFGRSQLCRWCSHREWAKVHVVRCGVDDEFLVANAEPPVSKPRFVCVGRLCEQKGQLRLVEAAAHLRRECPNLEIVLVGDGPMRQQIKELCQTLDLDNNVHITGWMSNKDVRAELEGSRAMVLPSFAEGLPVVIMESLGLGRPVISTFIAGIPELVADGVNGRLTPAGDVAALVEAMRSLLRASDADLRKMGEAGQSAVRRMHSAATEAGKLRQLFQS